MARGDHIRIYRGGYYHHGIDIGDGSVVHRTNTSPAPQSGMVIRTGWQRFVLGYDSQNLPLQNGTAFDLSMPELEGFDSVDEVETMVHGTKVLHTDHVCMIALGQVGNDGYDIQRNNCEHLAHWCKTGKKHSQQVEDAFRRMVQWGGVPPYRFIAGPALEQARYLLLRGLFSLRNAGESRERSHAASSGASSSAYLPISRPLFRLATYYKSSDGSEWLKLISGDWGRREGDKFSQAIPPKEFVFVNEAWTDDADAIYCRTPSCWFRSDSVSTGWTALPKVDAKQGSEPEHLHSAPFAALNAYLSTPETLAERVDAMEEILFRRKGDAICYYWLKRIAVERCLEPAGSYADDWAYVQKAALWTLGTLLAQLVPTLSVARLPGIKTIAQVLADAHERDDVRVAAVQALQAINRPQDSYVRSMLNVALLSGRSEIVSVTRDALAGVTIPLP